MLRKVDKIWHVDISHPSLRKRMRFSTRTSDKHIANKIHDSAYKEVLENSISGYNVKKIVLKKFISEFLDYSKVNHKYKTTESYECAFKKLATIVPLDTPIKEIQPLHIEKMKRIISNQTTYNIYHNHLKAAFNYAIEWEYIKHNPLMKVRKFSVNKETRRDIHPDELDKLITIITDDKNYLFAEFLIFMLNTGCRRQELLNLRWEDIYEPNYFELKNTKGKVDARIPLNETLIEILHRRHSESKPFNYLPGFATSKFRKYRRLAKLPEDIVLHSIRHATATLLFERQEHPLVIQKLIRHKDLKTTMGYTHTTPIFLKPAIDKMSVIAKEYLEKTSY